MPQGAVVNASGQTEFVIQFYGFPAAIPPVLRELDPAMQVGVFRQLLVQHIDASVPNTGASVSNSFLYAVDPANSSFLLKDTDTFTAVQGMSHLVFYKAS